MLRCACRGYHGDLNETFVVGEVDEEGKKLVRVTHEVRAALRYAALQGAVLGSGDFPEGLWGRIGGTQPCLLACLPCLRLSC